MDKKDIIKAIEKILPGINDKSIIEQAHLVSFKDGYCFSFNDEVAVSVPFNIEDNSIEISVPAKEFLKLLKKMKGKEINIVVDDNQILVSDGKTNAGFNITNFSSVDIGLDKDNEWIDLPSDFLVGVSFCMFSAANSISEGVLVCLNFESNTITSCDNYRITQYFLDSELKNNFMINKKTCKQLTQYNVDKYCEKENWVHFKNSENDVIFSCHKKGGEYPTSDEMFNIDNGIKFILPDDLVAALESSEILGYETNSGKGVDIVFEGNEITCRGQNDSGWVEEKCDMVDGFSFENPFAVSINSEMLKQILKYSNEVVVDENKMVFENEKFKHMISLLG